MNKEKLERCNDLAKEIKRQKENITHIKSGIRTIGLRNGCSIVIAKETEDVFMRIITAKIKAGLLNNERELEKL